MNGIREWFTNRAGEMEKVQLGGALVVPPEPDFVEPTEETWQEKANREFDEADAIEADRKRRVLEVWQSGKAIKLISVRLWFTPENTKDMSGFVTSDNLASLLEFVTKPFVRVSLYAEGKYGEFTLCIRSELMGSVLELPGDYILFEGRPTLVPEVKNE